MAEDKSGYFAEYYRKNRPAILTKRRLRYQNDPEYRERMREKARERARVKAAEDREHRQKSDKALARSLKSDPDLDNLGPQKVRHWPVGDFVTSSVVCDMLAISIGTLSNWIKGGILPSPTISSTAGKHLFSVQYLHLVRDCRVEALEAGMRNGEFGKLVNGRYDGIRDSEDRIRRGENVAEQD